jgi:hypothetical protein
VRVVFTPFPSGSAMLDVHREGRLYVMSFSPTNRFGVDEVLEGEGLQNSYRFGFEEFEPAAKQMWAMIKAARAA